MGDTIKPGFELWVVQTRSNFDCPLTIKYLKKKIKVQFLIVFYEEIYKLIIIKI